MFRRRIYGGFSLPQQCVRAARAANELAIAGLPQYLASPLGPPGLVVAKHVATDPGTCTINTAMR